MRIFFAVLLGLALLPGGGHAAPFDKMRLTPQEIGARPASGAGAGTSGVSGIRTIVLLGTPAKPGPYAIELIVPANTKIAPHTHRDNRTAVVVSGTWYFGYGRKADAALTKALAPGSFYTEPAGAAHFAITKAEPVAVIISGTGPTDTIYVNAADDPRGR
jgi:quercetin dioxygenase-like cupin family protein